MDGCAECLRLPPTLADLVGWRHFHTAAPCWELVHAVYRRHLGFLLPYAAVLTPRRRWRELVTVGEGRYAGTVWRRVDGPPSAYDGLLFRFARLDHIGLALDATTMIHVPTPEAGVTRSPIARWGDGIVGVYRYAGR